MPRKGQTTALERPTGVRGSIQEQPIKPPRNKKRVADENVESNAKTRKRAAFGDLTNVSNFLFSRKNSRFLGSIYISHTRSQLTMKKLMPMSTTLIRRRKAIQKPKLLVKALVENSLNPNLKKIMIVLLHLPKQKELVNFGWEYMT